MSKSEKWFWFLEAVILILGVVVNAISTNDVGLYLIIAGLVVQAVYFQAQLIQIRSTHPNVEMDDEIYLQETPTMHRTYEWLEAEYVSKNLTDMTTDPITTVYQPGVKYKKQGVDYYRYFVQFRNVMGDRVAVKNAENVHAKISFSNQQDFSNRSHEDPRWVGYPTPDKTQIPVDIELNGDAVGLFLLLQHPETKKCYIFSDESYTQNSFEPCKEKLLLDLGVYKINIQLRDNKGWTKSYSLKATIGSQDPEFEV